MGRLFDAVAALCGIRLEVTYEGQAAIELEGAAEPGDHGRYELPLDGLVLDARPVVLAVAADLRAGTDPGVVAARFHDTVAAATAEACAAAASGRGLGTVVLSGGVFANRRLLEGDRRRGCARRGCACSCPSASRRATAAWPTGRRRSRPRGRRRARAQRGTRGERNVRVRTS